MFSRFSVWLAVSFSCFAPIPQGHNLRTPLSASASGAEAGAAAVKVGGDGLTADEQRLVDAMRQYRLSVLEMGAAEIEKAKTGTGAVGKSAGTSSSNAAALQAAGQTGNDPSRVRRLQQQIKQFQRDPLPVPKLCTWKLKVGGIGYLVDDAVSDPTKQKFNVLQVVDANNMLIHVTRKGTVNEFNLGVFPIPPIIIWVSGVDTTGVTDGTHVPIPQLLEVVGTKQYATALGTKSVLMVSPFPVQDLYRVMQKAKVSQRQKENATAESTSERDLRTWTNATGAFTINARFGGIVGGKVVLVKEDGRKVSVTREQLSDADNQYIDEITTK